MSTLMGTDFDRDETTVLNDERLDAYTVGDEPDRALMYAWTVGELRDAQVQTILERADAAMAREGLHGSNLRIDRLEAQLADTRATLEQARANHQADIDLIGEQLLDQAERRDWCSEYDVVIDELNRRLHRELPLRNKTHTFRVVVYLDVPAVRDEAQARARLQEYVTSGDDHETVVTSWTSENITND